MKLPDEWLVRDRRNRIRGPFAADTLRSLIEQEELSVQDEVCHANSYWIHLHEQEEVLKQLGVRVKGAVGRREDEEVTETETETETETQAEAEGTSSRASVMALRVSRPLQTRTQPNPALSGSQGRRPPLEKPSFFKGVASLLLIVSLILFYWMIRLLKSAG